MDYSIRGQPSFQNSGNMASSAKSGKSKLPPQPAVRPSLRARLFRPMPLILLSLLIAAAVMIPFLPWLLPDLSEQPEYQIALSEMQVTPAPDWVPQSLLHEVLGDPDLPETASVLDHDLCRQVALAWERHPWIRRVKSVRLTNEPALLVDVEYRLPAVFVEVPQGLYPVDADGVVLPPLDFSMADTHRLPHLRNILTRPQGAAGQSWGDPVVAAGARLASILAPEQNLAPYWKRFGFVAILAPEVKSQPVNPAHLVFEIQTAGGSRVVWGKPPGADSLEPPPAVKLARLEDYIARFGPFDGSRGPQRLDIRLFDGISLQPLNELRYR
jgi:hypothetical protein